MNEKCEDLLKKGGWTVESESPFEIRHIDGSLFTGYQAERFVDSTLIFVHNVCPCCGGQMSGLACPHCDCEYS